MENKNFFFFLLVFFALLLCVIVFLFSFYWKKKKSHQGEMFSYYQIFFSSLTIYYKLHKVTNFYFDQQLPFYFQKNLAWKIFLSFLSEEYSENKMTLLFTKMLRQAKAQEKVNDLVFVVKVGSFSQTYSLKFVKIKKNILTAILTNWPED